MRFPPSHVIAALKNYDENLGMRWDQRRARWIFTFRGRDFMIWNHRDGTPALADLPSDEALSLVKEADNRNDGGKRMQRMFERVDRKREYEQRERRGRMDEASAQAKEHAGVKLRGGPKPFVTGIA